MVPESTAFVDEWLSSAAKDLPADRLLELFQHAFDALWHRAHRTLGDVTLVAIVDRILYNAAERYPAFAPLSVEPVGLKMQALREGCDGLRPEVLREGIHFVLAEFLTVLGNLTAEILTRALHAELVKVAQREGKSS